MPETKSKFPYYLHLAPWNQGGLDPTAEASTTTYMSGWPQVSMPQQSANVNDLGVSAGGSANNDAAAPAAANLTTPTMTSGDLPSTAPDTGEDPIAIAENATTTPKPDPSTTAGVYHDPTIMRVSYDTGYEPGYGSLSQVTNATPAPAADPYKSPTGIVTAGEMLGGGLESKFKKAIDINAALQNPLRPSDYYNAQSAKEAGVPKDLAEYWWETQQYAATDDAHIQQELANANPLPGDPRFDQWISDSQRAEALEYYRQYGHLPGPVGVSGPPRDPYAPAPAGYMKLPGGGLVPDPNYHAPATSSKNPSDKNSVRSISINADPGSVGYGNTVGNYSTANNYMAGWTGAQQSQPQTVSLTGYAQQLQQQQQKYLNKLSSTQNQGGFNNFLYW